MERIIFTFCRFFHFVFISSLQIGKEIEKSIKEKLYKRWACIDY